MLFRYLCFDEQKRMLSLELDQILRLVSANQHATPGDRQHPFLLFFLFVFVQQSFSEMFKRSNPNVLFPKPSQQKD